MSLRITQNTMNRTQLGGRKTSLSRLPQTQERLTTGRRLNRPLDDPVASVSVMRFRDDQRHLEQFGETITDGLARLTASDQALTETLGTIQRIHTKVLAAMNGTLGRPEREAVAAEIRELRKSILQQANYRYAGQPLFGGTTLQDSAFDPSTGRLLGNDPVLCNVTDAPGGAGQVNVGMGGGAALGAALFGGDTGRGDLEDLAWAIEEGNATIPTGLAKLDELRARLLDVQSSVGARINRLTGLEQLDGRQNDASKVPLSKVEDADFMKAAMDLSIQSNAYQAALSASAKVIQPSLMDFIR